MLAVSQGILAYYEYQLHREHEDRERRYRDEEQTRQRDRDVRAREPELLQLSALALQYRTQLESQDPEIKCGVVRYLSMGSASRVGALGGLEIRATECLNATQFAQAIVDFKTKLNSEGAPEGYVRRNPTTRQLYQETCDVSAVNLKKGLREGDCSLSGTVPASASIYRIEYACNDPRCGWSYHSKDEMGYAMDADTVPPAAVAGQKRSIHWKRRWDGDSHTERYVMYYELKFADTQNAVVAANPK